MKKGVHKFRTKQDGKLLQLIADGITQLGVWDKIREEVEVPEVYTFTYKNKLYTLEKGNESSGSYLLRDTTRPNKTMPVAVLHSEMPELHHHLHYFRDRAELLDYTENAGGKITTTIVSGDGLEKDPSVHFGPKMPRFRRIYNNKGKEQRFRR